jgi:hypothetical protein
MTIKWCKKILVSLKANVIFIFWVKGQNVYYIVPINNIPESKSYNIFPKSIRFYLNNNTSLLSHIMWFIIIKLDR